MSEAGKEVTFHCPLCGTMGEVTTYHPGRATVWECWCGAGLRVTADGVATAIPNHISEDFEE